jgi:hypothetical protein
MIAGLMIYNCGSLHLMIPNASKESRHIKLWSKMLSLLFEAEQQEDRQDSKKDDRVEIDVDIL